MNVEQRHNAERNVFGRKGVGVRDVCGGDRQVEVAEGHTLRPPGASAGVRMSATSSADGAVAEIPFGAFSRRTVPWSLISTENTGILRSAAALRASSAPVGGQIRMRADVSSRKKKNSSYGYAGFSGAAVPAMEAARKLTIAGRPFGKTIATRSPRRIPAAAKASAMAKTCWRSES